MFQEDALVSVVVVVVHDSFLAKAHFSTVVEINTAAPVYSKEDSTEFRQILLELTGIVVLVVVDECV